MSRLRAKCPDCDTYTAVALGREYECHACGRTFAAGLVRVPRAWGGGGEEMAAAATLPLPYPEAAVIAERSLVEQNFTLAAELPDRPLVLGGCCCAHVGAVEALAARSGRIGVVWLDAHGDLNTPETSPTGNLWGMPLRMLLESGAVDPGDVALLAARKLDAPEEEFIVASGLQIGDGAVQRALDGSVGTYVALDADALAPGELAMHMPEPGGLLLAEVESLLADLAGVTPVLGFGISGLAPDRANVEPLTRFARAVGL